MAIPSAWLTLSWRWKQATLLRRRLNPNHPADLKPEQNPQNLRPKNLRNPRPTNQRRSNRPGRAVSGDRQRYPPSHRSPLWIPSQNPRRPAPPRHHHPGQPNASQPIHHLPSPKRRRKKNRIISRPKPNRQLNRQPRLTRLPGRACSVACGDRNIPWTINRSRHPNHHRVRLKRPRLARQQHLPSRSRNRSRQRKRNGRPHRIFRVRNRKKAPPKLQHPFPNRQQPRNLSRNRSPP